MFLKYCEYFTCKCVYGPHVPAEARNRRWVPWNWGCRWLWATTMCMLETKPSSSVRANPPHPACLAIFKGLLSLCLSSPYCLMDFQISVTLGGSSLWTPLGAADMVTNSWNVHYIQKVHLSNPTLLCFYSANFETRNLLPGPLCLALRKGFIA